MASRYEPGRSLGDRQVRFGEQALRIEVCDDCPELARPGLPDRYSESGRRLFLVALVADRYGVEPTAVGKC